MNPPLPFGRICFVVLVMRKGGEQLKWFLEFRLYIGSFPCAHSYYDQFIQPGWAECVFCVFSLGLCVVCSFVLFDLFVCPLSFMFPWAVESSPLQVLALA